MNVKALFEDDDAVSPVIGVILMVAITVILAAVIGTFVLGLQNRVNQAAPTASFSWEFDDGNDGWGTTVDFVNITHDGGDQLDPGTISLNIAGTSTDITSGPWNDDITAGDSVSIADDGGGSGEDVTLSSTLSPGDEIRVIWTSSEGSSTQTIGQNEVN